MRTEEHYIATLKDYEYWHDRAMFIAGEYLRMIQARETVDSIELSEETVAITATEYYRGCEYTEWYSIPTSWLWDDNWEVEARAKIKADKLEAVKKAAEYKLKIKAKDEAARKKQYEELKKEFEVEKYDYDPSKRRA